MDFSKHWNCQGKNLVRENYPKTFFSNFVNHLSTLMPNYFVLFIAVCILLSLA